MGQTLEFAASHYTYTILFLCKLSLPMMVTEAEKRMGNYNQQTLPNVHV